MADSSETDTEVIPHLIEEYYHGSLEGAVEAVLKEIEGSYAIIVLSTGITRAEIYFPCFPLSLMSRYSVSYNRAEALISVYALFPRFYGTESSLGTRAPGFSVSVV